MGGRGSGGARVGAGRPSRQQLETQLTFRTLVLSSVKPKEWAVVIRRALKDAQAGDRAAREWLAAWLMGRVPDEIQADIRQETVIRIVRDRASLAAPLGTARSAGEGSG